MFERFTEKARRAVLFARFEASQSASPAIEPEHMLLGVLRDNKELFVKLTSLPDPERALRKSIQHHVPPSGVISTSVELPLSAATKSVLTRAFEESEAMGHKHIGPEHLLLGLLGEQESLAAKALEMSGINAENLRNVVGAGVREKTVAARILLERLKESIFECLDETFTEVHGVYLDK
jgi:ATP-dependent Clp protease ATP-binding subunit ClpC